jgi:hypothetical protein
MAATDDLSFAISFQSLPHLVGVEASKIVLPEIWILPGSFRRKPDKRSRRFNRAGRSSAVSISC